MNRRSLIVLLIGVVSALSGFAVAAFLEQGRCTDAGGSWNAATRWCQMADGVVAGFSVSSVVLGVFVGILVAVFLYRAVLFFWMRAPRPSP
jgi:hypothetical protein